MSEWIIICNNNYYDIKSAFKKEKAITWSQVEEIDVGDIVYIYVSSPYRAILYKCEVQVVNLHKMDDSSKEYVRHALFYDNKQIYMRLKLLRALPEDLLTDGVLKTIGISNLQTSSKLTPETTKYINKKSKPVKQDIKISLKTGLMIVMIVLAVFACIGFVIEKNYQHVDEKVNSDVQSGTKWELVTAMISTKIPTENTEENDSLDIHNQKSFDTEETHANQMIYLNELVNLENSDIVSYQIARDAYGEYYDYALGGKTKDIENSCGFSIETINDQYQYFQGSVIKNFDYKSAEGDDCVKIYLDGVCVFESKPQGNHKIVDFHIDISNASELAIIIGGANYLRVVDAAFTNEEEIISSNSLDSTFFKEMGEIFRQDESNIRTYLSVRDNNGDIYYHVLAGTTSDVVNSQTYKLNGQYRKFSGKALLNYDYRDIEDSDVMVEIYVDEQLKYKSPLIKKGMKTEEFFIDLVNANTMTIKIGGRNYARIADVKLL